MWLGDRESLGQGVILVHSSYMRKEYMCNLTRKMKQSLVSPFLYLFSLISSWYGMSMQGTPCPYMALNEEMKFPLQNKDTCPALCQAQNSPQLLCSGFQNHE